MGRPSWDRPRLCHCWEGREEGAVSDEGEGGWEGREVWAKSICENYEGVEMSRYTRRHGAMLWTGKYLETQESMYKNHTHYSVSIHPSTCYTIIQFLLLDSGRCCRVRQLLLMRWKLGCSISCNLYY